MSYTTEKLIAEYETSGLSQKEFCRSRSIPFSTFQYHLKKSRRASTQASLPAFIPVTSHSFRKTPRVIIIEGFDVQELQSVLKTLER